MDRRKRIVVLRLSGETQHERKTGNMKMEKWREMEERGKRSRGRSTRKMTKFRELFLVSVRAINAFSRSAVQIGTDAPHRLFTRFIAFQNARRRNEKSCCDLN